MPNDKHRPRLSWRAKQPSKPPEDITGCAVKFRWDSEKDFYTDVQLGDGFGDVVPQFSWFLDEPVVDPTHLNQIKDPVVSRVHLDVGILGATRYITWAKKAGQTPTQDSLVQFVETERGPQVIADECVFEMGSKTPGDKLVVEIAERVETTEDDFKIIEREPIYLSPFPDDPELADAYAVAPDTIEVLITNYSRQLEEPVPIGIHFPAFFELLKDAGTVPNLTTPSEVFSDLGYEFAPRPVVVRVGLGAGAPGAAVVTMPKHVLATSSPENRPLCPPIFE